MWTARDAASTAEVTGVIFNVQRCSFHDGPGVRTTVFLKGCPLSCPWCHNPEGIAPAPQIVVNPARCLDCGECSSVCPRKGGPLGRGHGVGEDGCAGCLECVRVCPTGAREVAGRIWRVAEVLHEVLRDENVYRESGGGVTFSGGEPMAQPEFLTACLEACRQAGVHTAVDTCGLASRETALAVAHAADLLLWDVKVLDSRRHSELVGAPLEPILDNLAAVGGVGTPIWLRLPLVAGLNDDEEQLAAVVALATATTAVARVSVLPYHATGTGKLHRLGVGDPHPGLAPPSRERLESMVGRLIAAGVNAGIGG